MQEKLRMTWSTECTQRWSSVAAACITAAVAGNVVALNSMQGQWRIQDFPEGGREPSRGGVNTPNFPENCMKSKEFGRPGGGVRPSRPPLDPPMKAIFNKLLIWRNMKVFEDQFICLFFQYNAYCVNGDIGFVSRRRCSMSWNIAHRFEDKMF